MDGETIITDLDILTIMDILVTDGDIQIMDGETKIMDGDTKIMDGIILIMGIQITVTTITTIILITRAGEALIIRTI